MHTFEDLLDEAFDMPQSSFGASTAPATTPAQPGQPQPTTAQNPNQKPVTDPRTDSMRKAYEASLQKAQKLESDAAKTQDPAKFNAAASARHEADSRYEAYQKTMDSSNTTEKVGMPQQAAF